MLQSLALQPEPFPAAEHVLPARLGQGECLRFGLWSAPVRPARSLARRPRWPPVASTTASASVANETAT